MSEREKLKKLAEAAAQGNWRVEEESYGIDIVSDDYEEDDGVMQIAEVPGVPTCEVSSHDRANAAYIAAANPSTILALLSELEQAERERDEASAETAACLEFLSNSLSWEGFRWELLTERDDTEKSNCHEENVRLLKNYLAEKGHGIKLLAALRTLREASRAVLDYSNMSYREWNEKYEGREQEAHKYNAEIWANLAALAAEGGK